MNKQDCLRKKRIRFIINPISGIGKQKKIPGLIAETIDTAYFIYDIVYTKAAGHAIELARQAATERYDIVVAVGGDGSINEVARGVIGTQTAVGIIPAGSGNGLSHFLKIPLRTEKAIKTICRMKTTLADTATLNGELFVSVAGVGFDAWVAEKFSVCKLRGFYSYAKVAVREYLLYQSKRYKIYVNGRVLRRRAFMITIANSNQFGFNAKIAPTASVNDGLIDVCIMNKPPIYMAIFFLPLLFLGFLHKTPMLEIIKTKKVKIIQRKNYIVHIDGDHLQLSKELRAEVNPLSLKIIVP
jgi:diacylglycerol kinase (ATP)